MAQTAQYSNTARETALKRRRVQYEMGKAGLEQLKAGNAGSHQAAAAPTASTQTGNTAREVSRARREAMSNGGKRAVKSTDRTRSESEPDSTQSTLDAKAPLKTPAADEQASRTGCECGCKGDNQTQTVTSTASSTESVGSVPRKYIAAAKVTVKQNPGRAASLARRQAMSSQGKAALNGAGPSAAQTARAANPNMSSRELAQKLREERSQKGKTGQKKCEPTGRMRPGKQTQAGAAEDAPWKVGASETSHGQTLTGTMVGRSQQVTGDEPSTCRAITGTEYLGADIFRQFCQADASKTPRKVGISATSHGNRVSGNEVGRSQKVTGDEPGTCKRVTGDEYVGANQLESFCNSKAEPGPSKITSSQTRKGKSLTGDNVGRSSKVTGDETGANRELTGTQYMQRAEGKAPAKVAQSATLRGGSISGTLVGHSAKVTGDEPGSCKNVTGDDYVGQEQYKQFCDKTPSPMDSKVGISKTFKNKQVTGTLTDRAGRVTGNEPGTCKAVTGTPYAGADQYEGYCSSNDTAMVAARTRREQRIAGATMTGQQPGIGGRMTGDQRGACEPVSGTPYVGADQFAEVCPAMPAETASPDYPQSLNGTPWGQFSMTAPSHAAQTVDVHRAVTGSQYEHGQITGPFGMASGKVTGTEETRFGKNIESAMPVAPSVPATAETVDGRVKSRVTGEGMAAGIQVTGDDWDRGDSVTGTEGTSAIRRNPTRRGAPTSAMAMEELTNKRNEDLPAPNSKVTGGSGNTEKGALITYSGGARG
ncbi:MAG: CsoS2 family carboxysome shell protein [Thioalkalispiraceae bacterium]|jgi:hypothetical protein